MKITIIPSDGAVYEDGVTYLNLSWEGTPENVHALQWFGSNGWIEYNDGTPNEAIEALPAWTDNALAAWDVVNTPEPEPEPTPEEIVQEYIGLIQLRLDTFAQTRGYDGILSACTYVNDPIEKFAIEGQYCVQARGETWATGYIILDEVLAGIRPAPTWEEVEAELPVIEWPN